MQHWRLDGSVTFASACNDDPVLDDDQDPNPRPQIPVTWEQLAAFATDPALASR
ncbi:hypothetical protein [Saccharopolyspora hordei]|uniref:Uncharacterized protein n=1 Tax=Saccharopolyspora hordei TaxID=1838 RepID=A0A853ACQ1_9PSEU|nr:hypothetical protein [Saccharopolyspora hordei]NYI82242.1 hypothetical protein [Saccharopolyspora hordei]